jgi:hypothetical protein
MISIAERKKTAPCLSKGWVYQAGSPNLSIIRVMPSFNDLDAQDGVAQYPIWLEFAAGQKRVGKRTFFNQVI